MKSRAFFLSVLTLLAMAYTASAQAPPLLWQFANPFPQGMIPTQLIGPPALGYDGTIYLGCTSNLFAVSPNGTLKWSFHSQTGAGTPAIGVDGTIYFTSLSSNFCAVSPQGTLRWTFATAATGYACPALGPDGTIFFGSTDGRLYALYPDGTKRWDYLIGSGFSKQSESPAIGADGTVYVGSPTGFYAFSPDGARLWEYSAAGTYGAPAIGTNGTIYFTTEPGYLTALNPGGSLAWQCDLGTPYILSSPVIDAAGNIYVPSKSTVFCVHPDGTLGWSRSLTGEQIDNCSLALCSDGTIVVAGSINSYGLRADGSIKWQFAMPFATSGAQWGTSVASDGTIFIPWGTYLLALAGGQPLASSAWPTFQKTSTHIGRYTLQSEGPPVLGLQPVSQTAILNSSVYFRVVSGGTPPLSFQWYKNTAMIAGATNAIFRIPTAQLNDAGTYTVTVSNSLDSATSNPAMLTVLPGVEIALYSGITVQGEAGAACQIDCSYDLSNTNNWTPLTNFTLPTATYLWIDPTPATLQRRFYRAILSP